LGVALIADSRSQWGARVGRCLFHRERFVINLPEDDGERGPMIKRFYCTKGCAVQLSRQQKYLKGKGVDEVLNLTTITGDAK
jgi:hypothetical protein